jgi:hypothetical protein
LRTYAYIDGFNFYYGAVKNTPYKWLDFKALLDRILLPRYDIEVIKYFTAFVSSPPHDPNQADRQSVYVKALRAHIPELKVILGKFTSHPRWTPFAEQQSSQLRANSHLFANVIKPEEKGSDVNIAVHLVNDAWHGRFDAAVVVSNDSDLGEALRIVRVERQKEVILLTPPKFHDKRSKVLKKSASRCMSIRITELGSSQLPNPIPGTQYYKPASW